MSASESPDARPLASVIIPAHNAEATLPACLAALNAQTVSRSQYELIVVDDGSRDATAAVARARGADRVLVLPHRGPAAARNAGIAVAHGRIILLTDADCEPAPDWMAEMLRPFGDPTVTGVKGTYRTRQREVIARLAQCEFEERYDRLERAACVDFVDTHSAAFRAQVLIESGGFDPAFPHPNNEDVDLSYRLARAGHRLVFNRRAAVYHHHVSTWWDYVRLKAGRGRWRVVVYRYHPAKALVDSYTPQLLKVQVALVYLMVAGALLSTVRMWAAYLALAALVGLSLSAVPFAVLVRRRDPALTAWAPAFVWARAAAFAVGVAAGIVSLPFFRRGLPTAAHTRGSGAA